MIVPTQLLDSLFQDEHLCGVAIYLLRDPSTQNLGMQRVWEMLAIRARAPNYHVSLDLLRWLIQETADLSTIVVPALSSQLQDLIQRNERDLLIAIWPICRTSNTILRDALLALDRAIRIDNALTVRFLARRVIRLNQEIEQHLFQPLITSGRTYASRRCLEATDGLIGPTELSAMIDDDSRLELVAYIHQKGAVSLDQWRGLLTLAISQSEDRLRDLWAIRAGDDLEQDRVLITELSCHHLRGLLYDDLADRTSDLWDPRSYYRYSGQTKGTPVYPNLCQLLRFNLELGYAQYQRIFQAFSAILREDTMISIGNALPKLLEQILAEHRIDFGMHDCELILAHYPREFNQELVKHLLEYPVFYRGSMVHYLWDKQYNLAFVVSRERLPESSKCSVMIDGMWIYSVSFILNPDRSPPFTICRPGLAGPFFPFPNDLALVDLYYGDDLDDLTHLHTPLPELLTEILARIPVVAKSARSC